jgi:hypothetical protein
VAGDGAIALLSGTGGNFHGLQVQCADASGSVEKSIFFDAQNENAAAVANMLATVRTDGGSEWSWATQPSGTRTDRRVERMRINAAGQVLVGTTVLPLFGTSNVSGMSFESEGSIRASVNQGIPLFLKRYGNTGVLIDFWSSTTFVGSVSTNGTNTAYNTSSDYRLKEDVQPMVGALDVVTALNPVTYKWKSNGSDGQGFIAHELQEIVPDCVTGEKDAVDADGNPQYQGIDTSFLVATLTAAIQEQQAIITDLKERIEALEGASV